MNHIYEAYENDHTIKLLFSKSGNQRCVVVISDMALIFHDEIVPQNTHIKDSELV